MIQLYDRDAAFAVEILSRVAAIREALFDAPSRTRAHALMAELEAWSSQCQGTAAYARSDRPTLPHRRTIVPFRCTLDGV